jgi:hypothetical protein
MLRPNRFTLFPFCRALRRAGALPADLTIAASGTGFRNAPSISGGSGDFLETVAAKPFHHHQYDIATDDDSLDARRVSPARLPSHPNQSIGQKIGIRLAVGRVAAFRRG